MSRQKMGLFGRVATVGAVGAVAGFAWRWMQRHHGAGVAPHRDLSRWEGEGGALASASQSAPGDGPDDAPPSQTVATGVPEASSGTGAWPFPHNTRH